MPDACDGVYGGSSRIQARRSKPVGLWSSALGIAIGVLAVVVAVPCNRSGLVGQDSGVCQVGGSTVGTDPVVPVGCMKTYSSSMVNGSNDQSSVSGAVLEDGPALAKGSRACGGSGDSGESSSGVTTVIGVCSLRLVAKPWVFSRASKSASKPWVVSPPERERIGDGGSGSLVRLLLRMLRTNGGVSVERSAGMGNWMVGMSRGCPDATLRAPRGVRAISVYLTLVLSWFHS